jgi:lipid kinase, YegS/Rv2252/BmrU family
MQKIAFIVNPVSGIGGKASLLRQIQRMFSQEAGWEADVYQTTGSGDAYRAALAYKEAGDRVAVVAVGGDGTVNQVANALVHSGIPMGIIPTGSGNGLARHLKIPMAISKSLAVLQAFHTIDIDSGSLNGQAFFCTAGIGFEANVGNRFNTAPIRGLPSYMAISAMEYLQYHPESYKIYVGEQLLEPEAFLVTFANGAQWGNNVYIAPEADITDGLLDMVIWKRTPAVGMPIMAMRLLTRKIGKSVYIEHIRGGSFRVERKQEGWVQLDGESCKMGASLSIEVHTRSLKVIAGSSETEHLLV